jgi:L-ascorbate metabolism protein UlaG (beta-lactamase superfamily)
MIRKSFTLLVICFLFAGCLLGQQRAKPVHVHYFYNSGWLVETSHHLLLFDFIPNQSAGITLQGLQKQLQANASGKKMIVFISHDHQDHFNDSIYLLQKEMRNIRFIFGWQPKNKPSVSNVSVLTPGDSLIEKDLAVFSHPATDDGSAFLVSTDSLTLYHAGDHALWAEEIAADYTKALYAIRTKAKTIDLAFVPAARGMFTKCMVDSVMEKSVQLAVSILTPKMVALQHIGCADKLYEYRRLSQKLSALKVDWIIPEKFNTTLY